jgi:N-acetylmuramoyl-L-alanine amidase
VDRQPLIVAKGSPLGHAPFTVGDPEFVEFVVRPSTHARTTSKFTSRIRLVLGCVWLLFLFPSLSAWAQPSVTNIRYWTGPERTRVVLDLSRDASYTVRTLEKPHRIVVEIRKGRFRIKKDPIAVEDGLIKRLRMNQLRRSAQVVLDLYRPIKFQHFPLKPFKDKPHRVVIDVFRPESAADRRRKQEQIAKLRKESKYIVVVDAGHGGEDPGAPSRTRPRRWEKDLALALARSLAAEINKLDGIRAVLTRRGDYFIPLGGRVQLAQEYDADLFLSVHLNSAPNRHARGWEAFVLSRKGATDKAARLVAARENLSDRIGGIPPSATKDEFSILLNLKQKYTMQQSVELAAELHRAMLRERPLPVRGVKQAGFAVLKSIEIPSVILEMGFMSNSADLRFLRSKKGRRKISRTLARGVANYLRRLRKQEESRGRRTLAARSVHVVRRGETLWRIARRYGTSVDALRRLNGLKPGDPIRVGDKLAIP